MNAPIIENCLELVRIDSLTGEERIISELIENQFSQYDHFRLKKAGVSLCYFTEKLNHLPTIGFFGHLDTVHNQQEREPYCDDQYLYGCGASDMKGGLSVMRELMILSKSKERKYNFVFVYYHSEEGPYKENGLGQVLEEIPEIQDIDFAFVLEPTNNNIQTGCLGVINALVHFYGKSCHSARPWLGENAIHKAGGLLSKLQQYQIKEYELNHLKFYEVLNATIAQGGQTRNVIPNQFTLHINYRFSPTKTEQEAVADLEGLIDTDATLEIIDLSPSGPICMENKITLDFQKFCGCQIEPKQAWTDIARLCRHGLDAVNYGPGDPVEAHQKNEKIPLRNLVTCYQSLSAFIFN